MTTKWTPGPWSYGGDWAKFGAVASAGDEVEFIYTTHEPLINRPMGDIPREEQRANARLIAASPEMAELLERISEDIVNQPEHRVEARALLARIARP